MFLLKALLNAIVFVLVFLGGIWIYQHMGCSELMRTCVLKW